MPPMHATFVGGKIVPDATPDWPEGTRLEVQPASVPPVRMMTDEEQGDDPESIAKWLAAFDAIPMAASSPFDDPAVVAWREAMRKQILHLVGGEAIVRVE